MTIEEPGPGLDACGRHSLGHFDRVERAGIRDKEHTIHGRYLILQWSATVM